MTAIVRSGARRLAGSVLLQRAPAAGAMLHREQASGPYPASAKMMSSTEQHALALPQSLSKAEHEIQKKVLLKTKIHERKEELYDLISATETSVHTDSANRVLLYSLSAQIKPRPDDSIWRLIRASKRRSDVIIRPAGIATGLLLGCGSTLLVLALKDISEDILKEHQEEKAAKEKEVAPP